MTDLKQAADAMFADLELLDLLQRHGDLRLHGAYEMDLMTWPEIDVWIFNDAFASADAWKLVGALAEVAPPTHVHVINQLDHDLGKTPPDCVSIDYRFRYGDLQWKLDICIGSAARHGGGKRGQVQINTADRRRRLFEHSPAPHGLRKWKMEWRKWTCPLFHPRKATTPARRNHPLRFLKNPL